MNSFIHIICTYSYNYCKSFNTNYLYIVFFYEQAFMCSPPSHSALPDARELSMDVLRGIAFTFGSSCGKRNCLNPIYGIYF